MSRLNIIEPNDLTEFLFVLVLSALPVISNFIGATIAEALPLSKQTLGLALHAAAGVLLAILVPRGFANVSTELIPRVVAHIPEGFVTNAEFNSQNMPRKLRFWLLAAFLIPVWLGATLGYWGLRGQGDLLKLIVLAFTTGTLMVAIVEEILPEAHQTQDTNLSSLTFIGSFALSMLFSSYLE